MAAPAKTGNPNSSPEKTTTGKQPTTKETPVQTTKQGGITKQVAPDLRCRCKHRYVDHHNGIACRLTGCRCIHFAQSKVKVSDR